MASPRNEFVGYEAYSPSLSEGIVHQKKKLRSWLVERLDVNDCPGCSWIKTNGKVFRLSWKHYGRPGFDEERDATIFRKWAEHTGRYQQGDPPDISTWKTRFRNALHKMPDIEEMTSYHQLDGNDPYRVYRFRTPEELEIIKNKTNDSNHINNKANINPPPYPYLNYQQQQQTPYYANTTAQLDLDDFAEELERQSQLQNGMGGMRQQQQQQQPCVGVYASAPPSQPPQLTSQPHQPIPCNDYMPPAFDDDKIDSIVDEFLREQQQVHQSPPMAPMSPISAHITANSNIPVTAVGVKLYFSDKEVECKIVNNMHGMRISHEPPPVVPNDMVQEPDTKNILSNIFGPLDAEQMYFPDSDDLNTQAILKNIQRGVVIIVKPNGDICATRLCQARVYVADNAMSAPRLLNRSEETLIYSFQNDFLPKLIEYQSGAICAAPSCECYFSLGQQWRPGMEPLKEMLTHFSVTHFLAKKIFKEIKAQKPLDVEISKTTSLDMIQKELQQMALANKNSDQQK